jgi:hypothetical protein
MSKAIETIIAVRDAVVIAAFISPIIVWADYFTTKF